MFKNLLVLFLFIGFQTSAQILPNIDFEQGNFNNWECWAGHVSGDGTVNVSLTPAIDGRHTLINDPKAIDPFGNFPMLCPNGSKYSVKLGNQNVSAEAERVSYTFTVPATGPYTLVLDYAVVLQNPMHVPAAQPRFTAYVYNVTDDKYIDCPAFDFIAASDLPGFKLSKSGITVYYKDWSSATIDLRNYAGKTVRLEFTSNDCAGGAHFGYAYLDLREDASSLIAGNSYCTGQNSVSLLAPSGYYAYNWYNADFSKKMGQEGQSLTISPPPPDMTKYALIVTPYAGYGCIDTFYTVVNKINSGFIFKVIDTVSACPGTQFNLTAPSVSAGSSPGLLLDYFTDSLAAGHLYGANVIDTSGTFYIRATNAEGCTNILPVRVNFSTPEVKFNQPPVVVFPATIDLSKAVVVQTGFTYSYYTNAAATDPLYNYTTISKSGIYYVKVANSTGCVNIVPVSITVLPPPPYTVTAPNTFTPNNDGINDHFNIAIKGFVTFGSLNIYNRNGQLVFKTKSPTDYWDGNFNNSKVPDGTYYWVFEGQDEYYSTKINRAGSITVIR